MPASNDNAKYIGLANAIRLVCYLCCFFSLFLSSLTVYSLFNVYIFLDVSTFFTIIPVHLVSYWIFIDAFSSRSFHRLFAVFFFCRSFVAFLHLYLFRLCFYYLNSCYFPRIHCFVGRTVDMFIASVDYTYN